MTITEIIKAAEKVHQLALQKREEDRGIRIEAELDLRDAVGRYIEANFKIWSGE